MMAYRKTNLMREVAARLGMPVDAYLLDRLTGTEWREDSLGSVAADLGIPQSTLCYWMVRFGMCVELVAVSRGERVYAIDAAGNERLAMEV